jgi:hypothetical protein
LIKSEYISRPKDKPLISTTVKIILLKQIRPITTAIANLITTSSSLAKFLQPGSPSMKQFIEF